MAIEDIQDRDSFKAWLDDKPVEWAQVLAVRIALRVAPIVFATATLQDDRDSTDPRNLILSVFRASFISTVACKYLTEDMRSYASIAATTASIDNLRAASPVTLAITAAARAISSAAEAVAASKITNTVEVVCYTAVNAVDANASAYLKATNIAVWKSIRGDCAFLEKLDRDSLSISLEEQRPEITQLQSKKLLNNKLWNKAHLPDLLPLWSRRDFNIFISSDLAKDTSFGLIADWYRAALEGKSAFRRKADIAIATMSREDWGDNAKERDSIAVMDRVAKLAGWSPEPVINTAILNAQANSIGNKWRVEGDKFVITPIIFDADELAASDTNTIKALKSLLRKVEKFLESAQNFDDIYGWTGFTEDYKRLLEAIQKGESDLVDSIWEIYDRTLTIASYLQQDNDLRTSNSTYSNSALSADHRRQLVDIVRSLAPFVRRFPSIQTEDENTANFLEDISRNLSQELVIAAAEKELITEKDRELIYALLQAMERNGLPAKKSGVRGIWTTRNLLIAAAVFVSTSITNDALEKSEVHSKISDWLSDKIDITAELVIDAPSDVQVLVQQMVDVIQKQKEEENIPDNSTVIANQRKKPL